MNHREQKIQTAIVVAFRKRFDAIVTHVPNGGARTPLEAIAFKQAGMTAGIPDLVVFGRSADVLMIEVKDRVQVRERDVPPADRFHSLSDSQQIVVPLLRDRGFTVAVVDNVEDAIAAGVAFGLGPKRAAARSAAALSTGF